MTQDPLKKYRSDSDTRIEQYKSNVALQKANKAFHEELNKVKYAYNFFWLGVPILQLPQDLQALQEIFWDVKPDLVIETGIAHGGSLIFSASMLALLEICGQIENGQVLGIDIDIRSHNKAAIVSHPMSNKITMYEGSSIDPQMIVKVTKFAERKKKVLVCLDSNHTHDHVLAELNAYAPLVSPGSYCMVGDTGIDDLPEQFIQDRPWSKQNNPKTAVREFLKNNDKFIIDKSIDAKLLLTGSNDGYLKRIKI
ncbi:MAG: cephalosporin hydroxylase [Candidatus Moranbacteria bacterium]|nr:cephalosporin hydroxylase [Candidatus Moranbacteria bacterium]